MPPFPHPARLALAGSLALVSVACAPNGSTHAPPPRAPEARATSAAPPSPAVEAGPRKLAASPAAAPRLPFIEDDYAKARDEATKRGVPLFVDVWASWCHSCMSMKEVVLPDPALVRFAGSFVFLSVDSENMKNEAFLERFPARNLPTLWVVDPKSEVATLKWIGAATAHELAALLDDASKERAKTEPDAGGAEATALFVRANEASGAGKAAQAIVLYQQALASGKEGWSRRPRALEALAARLGETGRTPELLELALKESPRMPPGTPRVNVLLGGIDAAAQLADTPRGRAGLGRLVELGERVAGDEAEPILLDDRSGLFESLVSVLRTTNPPESHRLAGEWARFLERGAGAAPSPSVRRVWDSHRLEAYLYLGEPERAVPMLEASERDFPDDYNPPARLARAYLAMRRLDDARAAAARALARCTGPRRLRIHLLTADILEAAKDPKGALETLDEALRFAEEAKLPRQYDRLRGAIEQRRNALRATLR